MARMAELHEETRQEQEELNEAMAELDFFQYHLYNKLSKYCNEEELSFLKLFLNYQGE